ncbi:MAG: sodium:solute symporter family protein [Opitutaceae bacterium]|nr:sodium:solute symporter family protein [Opitutaceae bacterium]
MKLALIDWLIILVYLIGCLGAGLWMRKFVRGVEDFAVAGREMDVNLGIASLAATELGLVTIMYTAQLGYEKGFAGATIGVLAAGAIWLVGRTGFVIGPLRAAGVMTIPELFQKRFGSRVRWLAGVFVAAGGLLNMGIFLRLGGEFLVYATGLPPQWLEWVMTALLGLVLLYTALGGMLSVLITDFLQFLVMGVGIVATSLLVLWTIGWSNLVAGLTAAWDGTGPGKMAAHPFNPFHGSSFGWTYLLWMFVFQIAAATTWQTQISRVLASKDVTTARRMYQRTSFYFVGRFLLPGLWGAAAFVWYAQHGGLPAELNSLTAMPHFLSTLLPVGIIGLVVAAMLAAEMSTDSGYMLTWATVIYNDIITPCLKRPLAPKHQLLLTRGLVLAIAVFLLFYGLWYELPGNAWDYLAVTGNIYLASVFTLLVAGLYWPRANTMGAAAALILGALGPIAFLILGKKYAIAPEIAGASSFALAAIGMIAGSLLGSPPARTIDAAPSASTS